MQIGTRKRFIQRPYCSGDLPQQGLSRRFITAMQQDERDHHQARDAPQEIRTFSEWVVRFCSNRNKALPTAPSSRPAITSETECAWMTNREYPTTAARI